MAGWLALFYAVAFAVFFSFFVYSCWGLRVLCCGVGWGVELVLSEEVRRSWGLGLSGEE